LGRGNNLIGQKWIIREKKKCCESPSFHRIYKEN